MKTGLVLEGGALRAIFSAGVCDALLDANVMPDYFIGVSAGAAYGTSYLSRQPRRNLELAVRFAPDRRYMGMRNLLDPKNRSYFGLDFAYSRIPKELLPFDYEALAAYPGTAEVVVTDLNTGNPVYLPMPRDDDPQKVLQATCAMPLLFPIYHIDGVPCLDGGVSDGIPWRRALDQGCDRVLVVLTRPRDYQRKPDKMRALMKRTYRAYPEFLRMMETRHEVYNADRAALFRAEAEGKVLVIAPDSTLGVSRTERDTEKLRLLWGAGYEMASSRIDEIRDWFGIKK